MSRVDVEDKGETARWEAEKAEGVRFVELTASVTEWATAFIAAQAELTNPRTDSRATIRSDKGSFSYAYLGLPALIDHVREVLKQHGLGFTQDVRGNGAGLVSVYTTIWHVSGHSETFGPLEMPAGNTAQAWGSAITYAKRYALGAVLGIAAEEDDDAQTQVKQAKKASAEPTDAASSPASGKQAPSEQSPPVSAEGGPTPPAERGAPPNLSPSEEAQVSPGIAHSSGGDSSSAAPNAAGTLSPEPSAYGEGAAVPGSTSRHDQLWDQLVQFAGTKRKALNAVNTTMKASWTEGHIADIPPDDIEHTLLAFMQREGVA